MTQNTSSAVMQQRNEPHDSLDDFPTQPWATRALIEHVIMPRLGLGFCARSFLAALTAWEPACNRGHMVKPLKEYFRRVDASDIHDYSAEWDGQEAVRDFLIPWNTPPHIEKNGIDWIITNPPFRLAEKFVQRAFQIQPRQGVAIIARTAFLEGVGRWESLFQHQPPSYIAQFAERVPMVKGRLTATGSTATAYCWLVWMRHAESRGRLGTAEAKFVWIPPCRKKLERPGDYA